MASSARELSRIRNEPEHLNWQAVGSALRILNAGLQKYAENEMRNFHALIANKCGPAAQCNCTFAPGTKPNPHGRASSCVWARELKKNHTFKNKTHIPWNQSDCSKWHDPVVGYWEVAKLYMSGLGSDPATVTDPNTTDVSPLLSLFKFCKHFKIQTSLLKAVTDIRNKWAHAPDHTLSDSDKKAAFRDIKLLMNDPELLTGKDVQDCKPKIDKAEVADLSILEENELCLIKEYRRIHECKKDKTIERIISFLIIPLLYLILIPWRHPSFLQRFLTAFLLLAKVVDRNGMVSDEGCTSAIINSPIGHLHYQQFDFSSDLAYKRKGFVGRKWFFLELDNIFETDRGAAGVLITGDPGSGKSALMSQLICSPYSSLQIHQNIIGFHFCEYSEKGKRDGARFVRNLVDQIAARLPGYSALIEKNELVRRQLEKLCQEDVTGCFSASILGPLRNLKPRDGLRYIVIDALDECFENDKTSEIVEILSSKMPQFPKWLKLIITSRNLTMVTKKIRQGARRKPLYANDDRNEEDIHLYVSRFISQNSFLVDRLLPAIDFTSETYDKTMFINRVIKRAEGNFLFVTTILQYLNDTDKVTDLRALPTSLFDLYNIFFERQFGEDGFGPFSFLFEVLLSTCSPLQLNDVEEILRSEYEEGNVRQRIEQVSCFLRFGHGDTVRIYHQSFAEWLINQSAVIHINKTRAHQNIAKFLLHRISERNIMNVTFGEIIELFRHILAGNTLEIHGSALDVLNITEMREHRTNQSILHHLARKPNPFLPVLRFFLAKFKDVDLLDENRKTPAFYAASEGLVENLRNFVDYGANVSSFFGEFRELNPFLNAVCNTSVEEFSFMHAAARKGHKDVVEFLLKSNMSFQELTRNRPTPLHLAAANGHLDVLRLFLDYGAKFDVIALHHAAARNHLDVVKFLLAKGEVRDSCLQCNCKPLHHSKFSVEDVHLYFCETALHAAVSRGYIGIVKILLAFGNEALECKHHSGKTVLMDAVKRNDSEMVDLLLENGANVTAQCGSKISYQNKKKMCSLFSMVKQDFLYTVYCTDGNCKCGDTAIHVSAKYGLWEIAEKLVSKNVFDLTKIYNCVQESALEVAISHGHTHFMFHTNQTYKKYGGFLIDSSIVQTVVEHRSDNALKHILDYSPIFKSHACELRWELLLFSVNWNPHLQYKICQIFPHICSDAYEDQNLSLGEWIQRVSSKRLAIIKLLLESCKDKSFVLKKKDDIGKTLLFHAGQNAFEDAFKYLFHAGADISIPTQVHFTLEDLYYYFADLSVSYRCYTTSDGKFRSCYTSSYDEILRYVIWWKRKTIPKCDVRVAFLLKIIIAEQMPLSLYELLKAGVDINCTDGSALRPFLQHLRLGGRQLSEVFKIFGVDILLAEKPSFTSSELHLIAYLALPDDVGNFFKPASKPPLQKLIDRHPDGVGILDKLYDIEGYLPLHRATQGGNLDAVKWFKSIGVNAQLKTGSGLTALDLSILYLGNIDQAELIAPPKSTPFSWRRSNHQVPLTISSFRPDVFKELFRTFFDAKPQSDFSCGTSLDGLSLLHIAAIKGMSVLQYVHKQASEMFPSLPLNCTNKDRLDPLYVVQFYKSLSDEGLVDKYLEDSGVNFEQERQKPDKGNSKTSNDIKSAPLKSHRNTFDENDGDGSLPPLQYPDREVEYYMVFNYLYHPHFHEFSDEYLHSGIPEGIRIRDCPGYHKIINMSQEDTIPQTDLTECSKIQVRRNYFRSLCESEILQDFFRKHPCPTMVRRLQNWLMSYPRRNRQLSPFIAKRLGWNDVHDVKDIRSRWPLFFLHNMILNKYKSLEYLKILNEALEVADVRFYSRNELLDVIIKTPIKPNITIEYKPDKNPWSTNLV